MGGSDSCHDRRRVSRTGSGRGIVPMVTTFNISSIMPTAYALVLHLRIAQFLVIVPLANAEVEGVEHSETPWVFADMPSGGV